MMGRRDLLDAPTAPKANRLVPAASAIVLDEAGRILLHKRTDNEYWCWSGGFGLAVVVAIEPVCSSTTRGGAHQSRTLLISLRPHVARASRVTARRVAGSAAIAVPDTFTTTFALSPVRACQTFHSQPRMQKLIARREVAYAGLQGVPDHDRAPGPRCLLGRAPDRGAEPGRRFMTAEIASGGMLTDTEEGAD